MIVIDYNSILQAHTERLKTEGLYRSFMPADKNAATAPRFSYTDATGCRRTAINWCSNDYLNMSVHEDVIAALCKTAVEAGAGSGGTRNISGTTTLHQQLEHTIASLHSKASALLFNGAYAANLTTLSTLGKLLPGLVFISDERNHASIIEGIRAGGNQKFIFRHNDTDHLLAILKRIPAAQPRIVVFESVYSMCGTVAPVDEIIRIAQRYNALSYIDEVHAVGLYGRNGAGITASEACAAEPDIINGTLAKGYGVMGGYIAGSSVLVDAIRSFGSGFIFTSSLSPVLCAAADASIKYVIQHPEMQTAFHRQVAQLRELLHAYDIPYTDNPSHITPIPIGDAARCRAIASALLEAYGLYLQPVQYPTVPKGEACLRIITTLRHDVSDMLFLVESLRTVLLENSRFTTAISSRLNTAAHA